MNAFNNMHIVVLDRNYVQSRLPLLEIFGYRDGKYAKTIMSSSIVRWNMGVYGKWD